MSTLLDKLQNQTLKKSTPSTGAIGNLAGKQSVNPEVDYALSKVIAKKLGKDPKPSSKWVDVLDIELVRQIEPEKRTPEQQKKVDAGQTDLTLVALYKGVIRVFTHLDYEIYRNTIGMQERSRTTQIRKYWFGRGFNLNDRTIRNSNDLEALISNRLISDITYLVDNYKQAVSLMLDGKTIPSEKRTTIVRDRKFVVDKGNWMDRVFHDWCGPGNSIDKTTYLFKLIDALAQGQPVPSDIPLDSLYQHERDILEEKYVGVKKEVKKTEPKKTEEIK